MKRAAWILVIPAIFAGAIVGSWCDTAVRHKDKVIAAWPGHICFIDGCLALKGKIP